MNLPPYLELLKNKTVQLVLGITLGILILIAVLSPVTHKPLNLCTSSANAPEKCLQTQRSLGGPTPFRPELQLVDDARRTESATYRQSITSQLPIYQDDIKTSVGITTTLNIYYLDSDPSETLRFEIYGVSYLGREESEFTNRHITAYKETFALGLDLLRNKGIDPSKLIFIYGDKEYVRDTANAWALKYKLLP